MNRRLPYALMLAACWAALAGPSPAEEPKYIDDQKLSADFSAKLIDLAKEGKCLKADQLQQKLTSGKFKVAWKQPDQHAMTPKQVYQRALPSVFVLGSVEERSDHPGQWRDGRLASAWALTEDGVLVTNWHVFDKLGKECYGVVNSRGEVFPLIDALGADPAADIALIRVAGKGFTPLPLAADEEVGARIAVLSHPGNQFYTFTQGHVTRYTQSGAAGNRQRWMSISADFAYGSSGAPVLNRFGAVVGMATVTSNIDYPADEPSADESAGDNGNPSLKPPQKALRRASAKGVFKTVAKPSRNCAAPQPGAEAETSLVQMVVKLAVPGRTIQEFCTAGTSSAPAKAK
jgi:S1-C subfamily serine protease